ncbi:DUF6461 domain-containing protein [Kitasatospora purpeofusca]|uniref:DUF6461 domain-containing protein n=1 Tax=Kitasatospora purpeofusca TaxID=67352 RepID=UPI0038044A29
MVDRVPPWWEWAGSGVAPTFCLNLVRGLSVGDVFAAYGADPERARTLSGLEADTLYPMAQPGALLRAGRLDGWTFCFEDREAEGVEPGVLARLSEHSEVVHLFHAVGMTVVERLENGRRLESFEPGQVRPPRGTGPHTLHRALDAELRNQQAPFSTGSALRAVARHLGSEIHWERLAGPLRTVYLPDARREPGPTVPPTCGASHPDLGHCLGTLEAPRTGEGTEDLPDTRTSG